MSIELSTVSFISALVVLAPLPLHWRTGNICTSSIMLWLAVSNIYRGINTILWADTVTVKCVIWCDIVVRLNIGSGIGVPASVMCICRRLARAASPFYKAPSSCEKLYLMRSEVGMCVVLPIIVMMLHVTVQTSRFGILEGYGCAPTYYPPILSLFIIRIPPVLLSWVGAVCAGVSLRWLVHRRVQFQQASSHAQPLPASGRYLRLVLLAITLVTFATVMSLFLLVAALQPGLRRWASWNDVHKDWREIEQISKDEFPVLDSAEYKVDWCFIPIASLMVFAQFGFDDRIIPEYKNMFARIRAHVFCTKPVEVVVLPRGVNGAMFAEVGPEARTIATYEARNDNAPPPDFLPLNILV